MHPDSVAADWWSTVTTAHAARIADVRRFMSLPAECACGWVGTPVWTRNAALAEHATHIRIVAGTAEPEGDPS